MLKPTAHLTIDSTKVDPVKLEILEGVMHGTEHSEPRLPMPWEVYDLLANDPTIGLYQEPEHPGYSRVDYATGHDLRGYKDEGIYRLHEHTALTEQGVGLYGL